MSDGSIKAFQKTGDTVSISATTTSGGARLLNHGGQVLAHNQGTVWAYFETGKGSAPTASATSHWLAPGSTQAFTIPMDHDYVAAATVSGTATIGATPGRGV